MRSISRSITLAALLLTACAARLAAQTGTLTGQVTASETSRPVAGASVSVAGTSLGTTTDHSGRYRIAGIAPGSYAVTVSARDLQPVTQTVAVRAGEAATADFALAPGSILLSGVVASATRSLEPAQRVTATVNVLGPEEIRRSPARTANDLLREIPGIELPRVSGSVAGPEQIVSIRGMDEGRTLVLLDNVPLNDPWGEWVDWQRAPVYALDRVEVTEGGGSSLYGNYAMGGVIQLVTRPIAPHTVQGLVTAGSRDLREVSLQGSDILGRLALSAGVTLADGGGYVLVPAAQRGPIDTGNGSTRRNANLRAEYALGADRTVSAGFHFLDEDRDAGTPLAFSSRRIGNLALGTSLGGIGPGRLTVDVFGTDQRQESHQSRTAAGRVSETPALVQAIPARDLGGSAQWSVGTGGGATVAVGADARWMRGTLDEDVYGTGGAITRTTSSGGKQLVGGAFVQAVVAPAAPVRVEASVRVDGWRNYAGMRETSDSAAVGFDSRTDASFSPRLGVKVQAARGLSLRGSVYRAFRAPSLSEQYRTFIAGNTTFLPNPQLGPEHLTGGDLGFDWSPLPRLELRATAFANEMRGLTDFEFLRPGFLMRQNVGKAHSRGVEAEAGVTAADWLRLELSYNYDMAKTEAGARVHRVPLNRWIARADLGNERSGEMRLIYRHEGPSLSLSGAALKPFDVVDASAEREVAGGVGLFVGVENLLDARYVADKAGPLDQLGLPLTVRVGVSIHRR
jgi:outer membrane receptor protein involved in Fe transport